MKFIKRILGVGIILITIPACDLLNNQHPNSRPTTPTPERNNTGAAPSAENSAESSAVEGVIEAGGRRFEIIKGDAFEVNTRTGARDFREKIYRHGFYEKNYSTEANKIYRMIGPNEKMPIYETFKDNFEGALDIRSLVGPERGWTYFILMSPKAPTLKHFAQLRQKIMAKQSDYLDNRIEPSKERAHSGNTSLKAVSVKSNMAVTKASLGTELLHFQKGDHVWFSGWFYIEKGRPSTLVDLESSYFFQGAGMRLLLNEQRQPRLELKWPTRPTYNMTNGVDYRMPVNKWVNVKLHYVLSEKNDGVVQLWMDDKPLINTRGQTIPLANTLYDRIEVGITANSKGIETVLFVDDIKISKYDTN